MSFVFHYDLTSHFRYFSIEEAHNPQNDRIWSAERPPEAERIVERQMKPKGLMVWCGVAYDAKAPLIFVRAGIKINTDVYRTEILEPVATWAAQHYGVDEEGKLWSDFFAHFLFSGYWNDWTFQQDGAPSHTSTRDDPDKFEIPTQMWLAENFPDFINKDQWPPASPRSQPA